MTRSLTVDAEVATSYATVAVASEYGGAGAAIADTTKSLSVLLANNGNWPFEYRVGASGTWSTLLPHQTKSLSIDMSAVTLNLRKAFGALTSSAAYFIERITGRFFDTETGVDLGLVTQDPATGSLVSAGAGIYRRSVVGNRNRPPIYDQVNPNTVFNDIQVAYASSDSDFSNLEGDYCGFTLFGAETPAIGGCVLSAGFEVDGVHYRALFDGLPSTTLVAGQSTVRNFTVPGMTLRKGQRYTRRTRRVTPAPNTSILIDSQPAFGDFQWVGTDPSIDFTMGGEPTGAAAYPVINASGVLTQIVYTAGGSGYTPNLYASVFLTDPDTTNGALLVANRTTDAQGTVALGPQSTGLVNTTGWGVNTYLTISNGANGFSSYGCSMLTGIPSKPTKSITAPGDSNASGFGATDGFGDTMRNFGYVERALRNKYGFVHFDFPGAYASNWTNETLWPLWHSIVNPYITHVIVQAGGNDVGGGDPADLIIQQIMKIAANWRARGAAVSFATPVPRTTGTFTSAAGQTIETHYEVGGALDKITNAIRKSYQGLVSEFGFFEARAAVEDPAAPNKWRSDGGVAWTDGSHTLATKLDTVAKQMVIPRDL